MKAMGLKGFTKRRRWITTKRAPGHRVTPDLVNRNVTATGPNQVYVGDITHLPCKAGKNMYEVSQVLFRLSRWENLEHAKEV